MLERRKQREGLAAELASSSAAPSIVPVIQGTMPPILSKDPFQPISKMNIKQEPTIKQEPMVIKQEPMTIKQEPVSIKQETLPIKQEPTQPDVKVFNADPEVEKKMLMVLCDITLELPCKSKLIAEQTSRLMEREVDLLTVESLLCKFSSQKLINTCLTEGSMMVNSLDFSKLSDEAKGQGKKRKRESENEEGDDIKPSKAQASESADIESLLSMQSTKQRVEKKLNEEIQALLVTQTAKEQYLVEKFKTRGGAQLQEFCQYGTREECHRMGPGGCKRLHFKKVIKIYTDESLGDCSFLNTCFHMDTCKYVHYEIDYPHTMPSTDLMKKELALGKMSDGKDGDTQMFPPQWIQCDLRIFDMSTLGKCAVVMADPPWDIHMELPYGTMEDNEMRHLDIPGLQDEGFIFLWVTGRAMELGRECLELWGYKRVDEIIWVKTNQLQRIIRTGRTGHWINHGKEHCLIGMKGNPKGVNKGMDCDVIVAEVRATSHKPDEIYGIIERLSPGTRKVELFGRPHNVQPNWITLGNQLEGVRLKDPDVVKLFKEKYPDGDCMKPSVSQRRTPASSS